MKIFVCLDIYPCECDDISQEEFILNWSEQCPHWDLLSDYGIEFFKGHKNWKRTHEI